MEVSYLNEYIKNKDEVICHVIDVDNIDFTDAYIGRKKTETTVLRANGGELIETVNAEGQVESFYEAKEGDAIFYNNDHDIYVPRDANGEPWKFGHFLEYGYELVKDEYHLGSNISCVVRSTKESRLLPNVILEPSVIKNAFGEGNHQFLFPGATLKQDIETGRVTGIDGCAFKETWEVIRLEHKLSLKQGKDVN